MPDLEPKGLDAFLEAPTTPSPTAAPIGATHPGDEPPGLDDFVASEKYGTPGQTAIAALEGGASGLTFGLSRLAETGLLNNAAEQKGRVEANPFVSPASTLAGAIAPIIATGGAAAPEELAAQAATRTAAKAATLGASSLAAEDIGAQAAALALHGAESTTPTIARQTLPYLAARAGKAISGAAGEGVLGRALGMGAEGAAYGAGNAVNDLALGDPHLTGQKVLADIGMGAAFGGGLGILSKGLEAALPAATKKLTGSLSNLQEFALGTAEKPSLAGHALSQIGSLATGQTPTDWWNTFNVGLQGLDKPNQVRRLVKNLQGIWDASKETASDLYEKAAPENIGRVLEDMPVENAKVLGVDTAQKVASLLEQSGDNGEMISRLSSPGTSKLVGDRLEKLTSELSGADTAFEVHSALDSFARDLDRGGLIKFDKLPTAAQQADQDILLGIRNEVRGTLKDPNQWGEAAQHYAQASDEYSAYKDTSKQFAQAFMRKDPATKQFVIDPGKVSTFFNKINDVGQDTRKAYMNGFLNQAQSLAKASENYHGFQATQDSISNRVSALARENKEFTDVAAAIKARAGSQTGGRIGELGLGYAAHALGAPSPIVGAGIAGIEAYKAIKNPYELGSTLGNTFQKLQVLGDIAEGVNKKIATLSKSVFSAPEPGFLPIANMALASEDGYDKRAERISELASNPNGLMNHLEQTTKGIYEAAPNVTQGVQSSMLEGIKFLDSKIPRPPNEMILSPDWEPSSAQKENFNRYYDAIDDPMSVFKEIKHGTLTNEMMETLQTVYPKLLTEMQRSITPSLAKPSAHDLDYGTKIALSKFMGQPMDESMTPQVLASNQAALQNTAPQTPGAPPKRNRSTLGGLKELKIADRTRSQSQQDKDNET